MFILSIHFRNAQTVYINTHTDGDFNFSISMTSSASTISSSISTSEIRKMKYEVIHFLGQIWEKEPEFLQHNFSNFKCFFHLQKELQHHLTQVMKKKITDNILKCKENQGSHAGMVLNFCHHNTICPFNLNINNLLNCLLFLSHIIYRNII